MNRTKAETVATYQVVLPGNRSVFVRWPEPPDDADIDKLLAALEFDRPELARRWTLSAVAVHCLRDIAGFMEGLK